MNEHIPARLRREAIRRARDRCEYCRLAQTGQAATFHIDHIVPRAAGGRTISQNLALACVTCSLRTRSPSPRSSPGVWSCPIPVSSPVTAALY